MPRINFSPAGIFFFLLCFHSRFSQQCLCSPHAWKQSSDLHCFAKEQLTTTVTGESSSLFPLDVKSDRAYDDSVRNGRKTTDEEKTSQVVGDEVDGDVVVVVPSAVVVDVIGFEELDAVEVFAFADLAKEC